MLKNKTKFFSIFEWNHDINNFFPFFSLLLNIIQNAVGFIFKSYSLLILTKLRWKSLESLASYLPKNQENQPLKTWLSCFDIFGKEIAKTWRRIIPRVFLKNFQVWAVSLKRFFTKFLNTLLIFKNVDYMHFPFISLYVYFRNCWNISVCDFESFPKKVMRSEMIITKRYNWVSTEMICCHNKYFD